MTTFDLHTIESAPEGAKAMLEGAQKQLGFVPNLFAAFAEAPTTLEAYMSISQIFDKTSFSPLEQQAVLLAASIENNCEFCVAAHSVISKHMLKLDANIIDAIRNMESTGEAKLDALIGFTTAMVQNKGFVKESVIDDFIAAGYTKANVLEVVLGVTMKTLSNYTNHVVDTPLNEQFASETWKKPTRA